MLGLFGFISNKELPSIINTYLKPFMAGLFIENAVENCSSKAFIISRLLLLIQKIKILPVTQSKRHRPKFITKQRVQIYILRV